MAERHAEATLVDRHRAQPRTSATTRATEIVKEAAASGRTLREVAREQGVDEETLDKALDLRKMAKGNL